MNESIATIGSNAVVLDMAEEKTLDTEVTQIELRANSLEVKTEIQYVAAAELLKSIKRTQKQVKDYWGPVVKQAYEHHKSLKAKENQMADPLKNAESVIKKKMGSYQLEQERIARELEEQRRKEAEAEAARKLEEAAALESQGDAAGAEYALAEAEVYDNYADTVVVKPKAEKVNGVSSNKTWKIKSIDASKVPVTFNGVELRPVDVGAVLRLVKASKGQITIPGVEIEEDISMSVRV